MVSQATADVVRPGHCAELVAVRHGESTANAAFASGAPGHVAGPDADIPLTPLGERQSCALGETLTGWPPERRPEVVLCSPYLRARRTYEALGFLAEGVARGSAFFGGIYRDELVMALLRPEWEERRRSLPRDGPRP